MIFQILEQSAEEMSSVIKHIKIFVLSVPSDVQDLNVVIHYKTRNLAD